VPGLAHPRVEPGIGDQRPRAPEAADVADRGQKRRRADHVHPGHGHQPARFARLKRVTGDQPLGPGDLPVEELDLAQRALERLGLLQRQLELRKPRASLDPEQVRQRRPAHQAAHQQRVDLVLAARPRAHQLLPARQPAAQHPATLVGHPHRLQHAGPQQPRQRARVEPVGLRPRPADAGVVSAHHNHPAHVRLEDPGDLPGAAAHLQRHPIRAPGRTTRAPPATSRPGPPSAPPPPRRSRPRRNRGARPTRSPSRPTRSRQPPRVDQRGEAAGERQRPIRARGTTRASRRGGQERQARARSASSKNGPPGCILPESPRPESPDPRIRTRQQPSEHDFHAPTRARLTRAGRGFRNAPRKRA
jgi:hypothetical protein